MSDDAAVVGGDAVAAGAEVVVVVEAGAVVLVVEAHWGLQMSDINLHPFIKGFSSERMFFIGGCPDRNGHARHRSYDMRRPWCDNPLN